MGVLHDYHCTVHGYFENTEPCCLTEGCDGSVMVVFLQPVGILSAKTKKTDKTINNLASDFKMTDIKSTKVGENQEGYFTRNNSGPTAPVETQNVPREPRPGDNAIWGGGQNGMSMKNILTGRFNKPVGPSLGREAETVGINPKDTGNLTGPRAASYVADHEKLSIAK